MNSFFSTTVTACDAGAVFQAPYASSFSLSYSCPVSASCPSPEQLPTKPPARCRSHQDALSQPPASCITTVSPKLMQGHGNASWTGTSSRRSPSNCFSRGHRRKGCASVLHGLTRQGQSTFFRGKTSNPHFPHNFYPVTLPLPLPQLFLTDVCALRVRQVNPTGENNRSVGRAQAELVQVPAQALCSPWACFPPSAPGEAWVS